MLVVTLSLTFNAFCVCRPLNELWLAFRAGQATDAKSSTDCAVQCLQVVNKEAVNLPDTIKTSQLHGPHTLLIGDAAHCVTPILGQGANAALEDTSKLVDVLTQRVNSVQDAPAAFSKSRLADSQALVDLNRYFVWATGLGPLTLLAFFPVLLHVVIGSVLSFVLPFVPKPALREMDKGASYSRVVNGVKRDTVLFVTCIITAVVRITTS